MEHWALHFHLQLCAERLELSSVRADRIFRICPPYTLLIFMTAGCHIDDSRALGTCPGRLHGIERQLLGLVHDPIINQTFCFGWRQHEQAVGGQE